MQLPMGRRIARPAADHQQHHVFSREWDKRCQGLVAALPREGQNVRMTAQGIGLSHEEPRSHGPVADRLGNVPSGMPCREQEQRGSHDLGAAAGRQTLERLTNRWADHLQESKFDGDIWQHPRHQCRDLPRLLGPHRVGRPMPHDHHAPRSAAPPAAGIRSRFPRPISSSKPAKKLAERAFHEATYGTGGEEGHDEGPFGRQPPAGMSADSQWSSSIADQSNL